MGQKPRPPPKLSATALHGQAVIKQEPGGGREGGSHFEPPNPPQSWAGRSRGQEAQVSKKHCWTSYCQAFKKQRGQNIFVSWSSFKPLTLICQSFVSWQPSERLLFYDLDFP